MTSKRNDRTATKRPNKIFRSLLTVGTAATTSQILLLLYSFTVARWLGPEKNGLIVANYSICVISSIFINFGLDTWLLRKDQKGQALLETAGHVINIKMRAGLLWGILLWGVLPFFRPNIYVRSVLILAILDTAFNAVANVLYTVLFKDNKFNISSVILILSRVFRLLSAVILILFNVVDVYAFIILRVIIEALTLGVILVIVKPNVFLNRLKNQKIIMRESLPYSISDMITVIYNQSDVNLISLLTNNLNLISYFSVAVNLVNAFFAMIMPLQNVFIPSLSRIFNEKSTRLIKNIVLTLLGFTIIGLVLWSGTAVFGEQVIDLAMGKDYLQSGVYLHKISPIFLIRSLIVGTTITLISINLQKNRIIPQAVATVVKVVFGVIVFASYNINGFLWVYIISEIVMLIGLIWMLINWFRNQRSRVLGRKINR